MNLLIQAANIYTPGPLKRKKLLELFACTAAAFECEMPLLRGLSYDELLRSYARFTAAQADQALRRDNAVIASEFCEAISPPVMASGFCHSASLRQDSSEAISAPQLHTEIASSRTPLLAMTRDVHRHDFAKIQRRLYDGAYRMGEELRRTLRVKTTADALAAARVLYRALGIDLQATTGGAVTVHRCFFSEFYSSSICRLIASLDEGLFAGLSGGERLAFTQRITEGGDCCKAEFRLPPLKDNIP